ncbi:hypothetical protein BH10PSE4_BH10PSE4_25440 [soil metagenome]
MMRPRPREAGSGRPEIRAEVQAMTLDDALARLRFRTLVFRLERDLAALFGRPVDLVTAEGLHPMIRARVLGETVYS